MIPRIKLPTRFSSDGSKAVQVTQIIETAFVKFTAWERTELRDCAHSCISSTLGDGGRGFYGEVMSRRLGEEFSKIPVGEVRFTKISEVRNTRKLEALAIIRELFPEIQGIGSEVEGEIETTVDAVRHLSQA